MRIGFTQSGGFAGLVLSCRIDTTVLEASERETVEQLVVSAGIEESCERVSETSRDTVTYEIVIERTTLVRVVFDEILLPDAARPLVAYLKGRAKPGLL
ncbi:MAG: protealysin inhibitor emfourin [Pirellulales bacterium]|jgi:hypothetical protein